MLKLNKYLKEIGINKKSFPFNEKFDKKNEFKEAELWNLDYTLSMIIYSYLCEFRKYYADGITPSCFGSFVENEYVCDDNDHEKWLEIVDSMIDGFKLCILEQSPTEEQQAIATKGKENFIEYYHCLWI